MAEAPPKFFDERSDKVDYAEGKEIGHSLLSLNNIYVLSVWHGEKEISEDEGGYALELLVGFPCLGDFFG